MEGTDLKNSVGGGWLKRASLLVALVILAGAFLATVTVLPGVARAATLYVGGIGPGNYTRIQYAIENATAGDTVFIYSGTYVEQVEVDKALSLVGEDRNTTIVDGGGQGTVVNVTADGVNITGLSVTNSSSDEFDAGFVLYGVRNCHIFGNNATTNGGRGIYANASHNNVIEDNEVYLNQWISVHVDASNNNTLIGNTLTPSSWGAITLIRSVNTTIARNTVRNSTGGVMIDLQSSDGTVIANNTLGSRGLIGVRVASSTNVTIANNTILGYNMGVNLSSSSRNTLVGNTFLNNSDGIVLTLATDNKIGNNTVLGSDNGIDLQSSSWNHVANNTFSLAVFGIIATASGHNDIRANIIDGSSRAILMGGSDNNTIANNTLSGSDVGIDLSRSRSDTIVGNIMSGGVYIQGDRKEYWNTHSIATSNTAGGRPVYYWKNVTGGTVPADAGQVLLANCSGVTVANQIISRVIVGIEIGFSSDLTVSNNSVSNSTVAGILLMYSVMNSLVSNNVSFNSGDGIRLVGSRETTIWNNTVSYDASGVRLEGSGLNTLTGNTILRNTLGYGIYLSTSNDNTLSNNVISDNAVGVYVFLSAWDGIAYNQVVNNSDGVILRDTQAVHTVFGNTISRNGNGLAIIGSPFDPSNVYHNNFLGNANQTSGGSVTLDDGYPSGGNFWSDYVGLDNRSGPAQNQPGGDGIGDTPYVTQVGTDRYPLTYPVTPPPVRPSRPQNLGATAGDRQVALTWDSPATDGGSPITNYTVYRALGSGAVSPLVDLGPVLGYTDVGLTNGQAYRYAVVARNAVGAGPVSNEATATPFTLPSAPQNLTAAGADRQVVLSWSPPADDGGLPVTNYVVYRGLTSGGEAFLVRLGNVLAHTDTGLTNGVTYYYKVAAENAAGEGPNSTEASATPWAVPSEPRNPNAVAGDAQVTLTWTAPATDGGSPITNYRVYRGTSPGGETFLTEIGNIRTYVDSRLTNGRTYYYRVSARNAFGEGPLSGEVQGTPATLPGPPTSLVAIAGVRQITLYWFPPASGGSAITGYRIYRGTAPGGETLHATVGNVTTYPDAALPEGQTFYYKVAAVNGLGEGPQSSEASATTASRPLPPLNPRTTAGDGRVTLGWDVPMWDGGSAITGYRVYRGTVSGSETPLVLLGVVYSYADTGLTNGVTYYYKVAAVNGVGEGPLSDEASSTPATVPSMPLSLLAVPGRGEVALTWDIPSSDGGSPVTGYRVYRGTSPGGETFLNDAGSSPAYTDRGLVCGQTYYYRVSAVNAAGEGAMSDESSATPVTVPGSPRLLVATAAGRQVTLRWWSPFDDGGTPVTGYRVHRGTTAGGETFLTAVGAVLTYVDASVAVGVTYFYQVSAVNAVGEGERSAEARASVANELPGCAVQTPGEGDILFGTHSISGTAQDPDGTVQRVEVRIDNGVWVAASGTDLWSYGWDTRNVTDGVHTIYARAYDGLAYSAEATVTIVVRNTVSPPPVETPVWQQAWFWILIIVLAGGAVVAYRYMQRKPRGKEPEE